MNHSRWRVGRDSKLINYLYLQNKRLAAKLQDSQAVAPHAQSNASELSLILPFLRTL